MIKLNSKGFTLIELSIVLVIIGLIVGGVLTGQDLIRAASVRAQISQIEKYNTAVNTFKGKYYALPGDLNASVASQFGFTPRGSSTGQGDGNGVLQGSGGGIIPSNIASGETGMFWVDLTTANGLNLNLIDGSFSAASPTAMPTGGSTGTFISLYFPQAKIGNSNYIFAYSYNNINYYSLSPITNVASSVFSTTPNIPVTQAYNIDKKMDDGLPETGNVTVFGPSSFPTVYMFDSGCTTGGTAYAISSSGATVNCQLSFAFQ